MQPLAFTVDYLSGEVLGQVATDTVRLAQYEIASQVFGGYFVTRLRVLILIIDAHLQGLPMTFET